MRSDIFLVYFSQILRPIVPIFFIPIFFSILSKEEFALVTFLSMLLGWIALIDAGMSGSLMKYVAISKSSVKNLALVKKLFFKVVILLLFVGGGGGWLLGLAFNYFGEGVLQINLKFEILRNSIFLILSIFLLQLIRGAVVAVIEGFELHKFVAFLSIIFLFSSNSVNYLLIRSDWYLNEFSNILIYLSVFLFFILMEVVILFVYVLLVFKNKEEIESSRNHPDAESVLTKEDFNIIRFFKLTFQLSILSIIWVILSNIDKLILSFNSDLSRYSFYQISFQLCSAVMMLYIPISKVIMPRLMALFSQNNFLKFDELLSKTFFIFSIITFPGVFLFFEIGENLLNFWIKDENAASEIFLFSKWVLPGFYFAALNNFSFLLFHSTLNLKKHLNFYARFVILILPVVILASYFGGMIYSAVVFFMYNFLYFLIWTAKIFLQKYEKSSKAVFFLMLSLAMFWFACESMNIFNSFVNLFFVLFYNMSAFYLYKRVFKS